MDPNQFNLTAETADAFWEAPFLGGIFGRLMALLTSTSSSPANMWSREGIITLGVCALATAVAVLARAPKRVEKLFPVACTSETTYFTNGPSVVKDGMKKYGGKPFCINTGFGGHVVILHPKYTEDLRSDKRLSSSKFPLQYWMKGIAGFEPYIALGTDLLHTVIKANYTQKYLGQVAPRISAKASQVLSALLGESTEWREAMVFETLYPAIAQTNSTIFLSDESCPGVGNNWVMAMIRYNTQVAAAGRQLRQYPTWAYRWVHWFLPSCKELRKCRREAQKLMRLILENRKEKQRKWELSGPARGSSLFNDSIRWHEDVAAKTGEHFDQTDNQLGLAISAIQTSTDLITQTLVNLAQHPEVVEALRQEITTVMADGKWDADKLRDLKLMDSVCKETLRLKPVAVVAVARLVTDDFTLHDGTKLPKNAAIAISSERMWSSDVYDRPEQFDAYRFLSSEPKNRLVCASAEHFGFGFGNHACPGRYFGATSVKMLLSHILLKYDFKLAPTEKPAILRLGFSQIADLRMKFMFRRRATNVSF
ncbi:hypothetical protein PspLS_10425 [Pyricularia sp. CBS 133598]|nr:hypothetical protein PspLS_10425 [Pyricularia sp. CBS 133598]